MTVRDEQAPSLKPSIQMRFDDLNTKRYPPAWHLALLLSDLNTPVFLLTSYTVTCPLTRTYDSIGQVVVDRLQDRAEIHFLSNQIAAKPTNLTVIKVDRLCQMLLCSPSWRCVFFPQARAALHTIDEPKQIERDAFLSNVSSLSASLKNFPHHFFSLPYSTNNMFSTTDTKTW